jgi:hypothetical protein
MLLHLSFNFWDDRPESKTVAQLHHRLRSDDLRCDDTAWDAVIQALHAAGANQVIIDIGDGVRFDSHPEIAVNGAWSKERLSAELAKIRELGITPIPKFNFSAGHDEWMGTFARMISTPAYYDFCRDMIAEASELFGRPEYFHIGMDEENEHNQHEYRHAVIRQHELWYEDLHFYADEVVRRGSRPWMWSDKVWEDETRFLSKVSRDIVQSNWYYGLDFNGPRQPLRGEETFQEPCHIDWFSKLDEAGFDQVPAGSNYATSQNIELLAEYAGKAISPNRLLGFMQTTWYPTLSSEQDRLVAAAEQLGAARRQFK